MGPDDLPGIRSTAGARQRQSDETETMSAAPSPEPDPPRPPRPRPADGLGDVVDSPAALTAAASAFATAQGPVAVDAERASGFRYGQQAYLVQLRRSGAGTAL